MVLHLAHAPCLVVGGGPVATRRVGGLLEVGAEVTVVAPQVTDELRSLVEQEAVVWHARRYQRGDARGARFVVTATGRSEVDGEVIADAREAGLPVACADQGHEGTVQLPAVLRRGPVTVAISTGGASPALAAWIRGRLEQMLGPEVAVLAELVEEARNELQRQGRSTDTLDWAALIDEVLFPLVQAGRTDEARAALQAAHFDALVARER